MKILHIEDCDLDAELVHILLAAEWPNCEIDVISSRVELVARLQGSNFDIVLSDFALGSFTGWEALRMVKQKDPGIPFIFLSGNIGEDCASQALRAGAQDYVMKDRMKRLVAAVYRALQDRSRPQ